jgi:ATP-binding cassette subfamily B protein
VVFFNLFGRIRSFFKRAQAVLDRLNKVIKESIVAAGLVRIINSQNREIDKFNEQNNQAKDLGMSIMKLFSGLIPTIGLLANSTVILILLVGGKLILAGEFTVGDLTAFNTYVSMLIFPMIMLGFVSNMIARAMTSYQRIEEVLNFEGKDDFGDIDKEIKGKVEFKNVSLSFGQKQVLKEVSFEIKPGSKTAILGPTAAGKTQIFYLMSGLMKPNSGEILIDGVPVKKYCQKCLSGQLGLVFQDSSLFNLTIRENINFQNKEDEVNLKKAIETAALDDFIKTLPDGLETKITERGSNLSGGQKQRLTLARALAVNPKILLLDDFTARVDRSTEKDIFARLKKNYGDITQVLITQQIASVEDFDQIILIMEGEVLAKGTHKELLKKSPEYKQLYSLQMSTE